MVERAAWKINTTVSVQRDKKQEETVGVVFVCNVLKQPAEGGRVQHNNEYMLLEYNAIVIWASKHFEYRSRYIVLNRNQIKQDNDRILYSRVTYWTYFHQLKNVNIN